MSIPKSVSHSAFAGRIGVAREEITPPVGIFCRNWGAAKHDVAEGIHRALTLTALSLQKTEQDKPLVLIEADLSWWVHLPFERQFRQRILEALQLEAASLIFGLSHTHAAPPLCDPEPQWKGGELLPAYVEKVCAAAIQAARQATATAQPAILEWHYGHCSLAADRDWRDGKRIVCGFNPEKKADDTLLVGRVSSRNGRIMATVVNYACHPTTLAWDNKLASPDYVGAMRETIQQATGGAPALFLQGASGELAPRHQYVGDPAVADAHGRQLAFAALSTLADMEPPGQEFVFDRIVESGAPVATWHHQPRKVSTELRAIMQPVDLVLKDLPSTAELQRQYETCRDRTMAERLRRKLRIRQGLGDGKTFPVDIAVWRVGEAILAGTMMESYSWQQQHLREQFPERAVVWMNLVNGSLGYLPPANLYDEDVYQVWQTPFERGSLEVVAEATEGAVKELLKQP